MNIDFESYYIFCKVAEFGNITKTAKKLYISQPAITQRINRLENYLNCKLFYRNINGVVLTEEGNKLYNHLKNSINILEDTENIFKDFVTNENKEDKILKICMSQEIDIITIYRSIVEFSKAYPNVKIHLENVQEDNSLDAITNNKADIAILVSNKTRKKNIEFLNVTNLDECFYTSKTYYDKNISLIKNNNWENCTFILPLSYSFERKLCDKYCLDHNIFIHHSYEIGPINVRNFLVSNNFGIAFGMIKDIQKNLDSGEFVCLDFASSLPCYPIFVAMKKNSEYKNMIYDFVSCLKVS